MSLLDDFLLPLVSGGPMRVGRPIGPRRLETLLRASAGEPAERVAELARVRHQRARVLIADLSPPPLDEATIRLGAAMHNLLALGRILDRAPLAERVAAVTETFADLGPPATVEEAVQRHSLLARVPEIVRTEHTVETWVGRRQFVGRPPPARILALARLRRVSTSSQRRSWLKEIGVPATGRGVWMAVARASPLGEALDPLRLDPPPAWTRILPVLRFPVLARVIVNRLLELGAEPAGGAMVDALVRFASVREAGERPAALAFAVQFLAHLAWLDLLFGGTIGPGSSLATLLAEASRHDPRLVWPPDVIRQDPLGQRFAERLARFHEAPPLRPLCALAASGLP